MADTVPAAYRAHLSKDQMRVLHHKGTERPGSSVYNKCTDEGVYHCVGCDAPLYKSNGKFDSGCGWPAFFEGIEGAILQVPEDDGSDRVEIRCAKCGGHLGHVFFDEGFKVPQVGEVKERHCVNGIVLNLKKED